MYFYSDLLLNNSFSSDLKGKFENLIFKAITKYVEKWNVDSSPSGSLNSLTGKITYLFRTNVYLEIEPNRTQFCFLIKHFQTFHR